jgi:hypothetical protein
MAYKIKPVNKAVERLKNGFLAVRKNINPVLRI